MQVLSSLEFEYSGVMFVSVGFLCWFLVLQCQQLVTRRVAVADIWLLSQSRAVCMELPWVTHGRLIVACGRRCGVVALWRCGVVALWHCGVVALRVFTDYIGVLVMEGGGGGGGGGGGVSR